MFVSWVGVFEFGFMETSGGSCEGAVGLCGGFLVLYLWVYHVVD